MGRDKGYGSGKSRSAANSASRRTQANSAALRKQGGARTAAARKSAAIRSGIAQIAAKNPVTGFIPGGSQVGGISVGLKNLAARGNMLPRVTGQDIATSASASARARAYELGRAASEVIRAQQNVSRLTSPSSNYTAELGVRARNIIRQGQAARESASRTNPTPFSRAMDAMENRTGVQNPTLREARLSRNRGPR